LRPEIRRLDDAEQDRAIERCRRHRSAAAQQAGRGNREDSCGEQPVGGEPGPAAGAEADGGIVTAVGQVDQLGRGLDLDIEIGPA
jgi:hypothetical protein